MLDLAIIGGGPAGFSAAIYAARAGLSFAILEQDGYGGGQIASAYQVQNYPGCPALSGAELSEQLRGHAVQLGAEIRCVTVVDILPRDGGFTLVSDEGPAVEARAVIAATGAVPKTLGVPGEAALTGRGVSYCATCDGAFFRGANAVVVGGGDAAVDDAICLSSICAHVTLVMRRSVFRAAPIRVRALKALDNVSVLENRTVLEIEGAGKVRAVRLQDGDGNISTLPTDAVFIAIGSQPASDWLKRALAVSADGRVCACETGATEVPGLYVAGDLRRKSLYQAITAAADGANAASAAAQYLRLAGAEL